MRNIAIILAVIFSITFLLSPNRIMAFTGNNDSNTDTNTVVSSTGNQFLVKSLDSLTGELFSAETIAYDTNYFKSKYGFNPGDVPEYSDSVYRARIGFIPAIMPLTFNTYVKNYINVYAKEKREQVQRMIGLSKLYFPMIEQKLEQKNMPIELKYLAVIESALNPNAVSRSGATGIWQLMYSTARMLNLHINSYIDERRDPEKATDAALNYLSNLYNIYHNWFLVIAAYNCGPGNVNKAIRRSGGKRDYWAIRRHLPAETRGYVPAFIAAAYIMNYYEYHNLYPDTVKYNYWAIDTVIVRKSADLSTIAKFIGDDVVELEFLNPSLKRNHIPASKDGFVLKLPLNRVVAFDANRDSIFNRNPELSEEKTEQYETVNMNDKPSYSTEGMTKFIYTVKMGDNLGYIAEWYDCRAQDIRNWNNIYGNSIRAGQKLTIYVPDKEASKYSNINNMSFSDKQAIENADKQTSRKADNPIPDPNCNCIYHVIKAGDTLWDIANKYPGMTIDKLKKINNISNSYRLKPGMVLKIEI